ncbi:hypothetical protein DIS24_g9649, partial [Lasiodiplodia hormozganensis]
PAAPAWPHLAWLWRSCRSASTLTRAAAEQVFIDRHLRRQPRAVQVLFPLGPHAVVVVAEEGGGEWSSTTVYDLEVPMGFVGFEDDEDGDEEARGRRGGAGGGSIAGRRAVFRDERPVERFGEGVLEETMVQWKEAVGRWAVPGSGDGDGDEAKGGEDGSRKKERKGYVSLRPEAWRYWVQIRGLALDPELPDLRIDYEKREISFDWRRMLDELFGEEAYARRLMMPRQIEADGKSETQDEVETSRELEDDAGRMLFSGDDGTHIPKEGMICDGDSDGCTLRRDAEEPETRAYLAARRQRIEKWYKKRHGRGDWSTSEAAAALPSEDADGPDRVVEMLRLREDLAKDVSLCDNAKEIRMVYRWNTEHDSIRL